MESDSVKNRRPAVAGSFYPAGRENLEQTLESYFDAAAPNLNLQNIKALIAPHAGYVYSGIVAASAFNQLSPDHSFDNVFLIGSSHHTSFNGASVYTEGNYITPLGIAKVNLTLAKELAASYPDIFRTDPEVQNNEHSIEVQVPFLQYIYKNELQIVPIVIAAQNTSTIRKIADVLSPYFNGNNLFVISTDFSHYPEYESACRVDEITANAIRSNSPENFLATLDDNEKKRISNLATSICGWTSVLTLLDITGDLTGVKFHEILYKNSGDAEMGDKDRVVGYHAMALTIDLPDKHTQAEEEYLTPEEKKVLLHIARVTIGQYLETGRIPEARTSGITDKLMSPAGVFVTLTKDQNLRGCIGQFNADRPLYRVVQEMAVSAATRDYRFVNVKKDELDQIEIEISVLTPMKRINSLDEIKLGKHGVYIKKGNSSGTYLPQVANQVNWTVEEFVSHCAHDKAGIGWDGWRDAEIYTYEAYVFHEE